MHSMAPYWGHFCNGCGLYANMPSHMRSHILRKSAYRIPVFFRIYKLRFQNRICGSYAAYAKIRISSHISAYAIRHILHISQQLCKIDSRYKLSTNRKPYIANPTVTWQMTSRDPQRSRSWPRYVWSSISRQPWEIHGPFTLTTNRKPHIGNPEVTWPMTSRDPKRSVITLKTFEA